jgi:hypothetical protein
MNENGGQRRWAQIQAIVNHQCSTLTDDELVELEKGSERLGGKLQRKYGLDTLEAKRQARTHIYFAYIISRAAPAGDAESSTSERSANGSKEAPSTVDRQLRH